MTQQQQQQQQHGDIFTAEQLLGKRRKRGQLEYLVQWQGFSHEHNTWEPRENILDPELIRDFNDRIRGIRKSRMSPKSPKHLHQHHLSHDKRRDSVETALRRTVDALWHQMTTCDKPRHMSTDSSSDEMTSYYETGLRGSTGISSSSSSTSSSGDVSPVRFQPPTLSPYSPARHSDCTTQPRHQPHYDPPTPSVAHSAPSLGHSAPHSPAMSDDSYSSSESPEPMMTSPPMSRQSSLTSLEDVEKFVSTPYWRYSPHRMPPKKRWLVCELLNTPDSPVTPVSTVHACHHSFPICHFTEDKLARRA